MKVNKDTVQLGAFSCYGHC